MAVGKRLLTTFSSKPDLHTMNYNEVMATFAKVLYPGKTRVQNSEGNYPMRNNCWSKNLGAYEDKL